MLLLLLPFTCGRGSKRRQIRSKVRASSAISTGCSSIDVREVLGHSWSRSELVVPLKTHSPTNQRIEREGNCHGELDRVSRPRLCCCLLSSSKDRRSPAVAWSRLCCIGCQLGLGADSTPQQLIRGQLWSGSKLLSNVAQHGDRSLRHDERSRRRWRSTNVWYDLASRYMSPPCPPQISDRCWMPVDYVVKVVLSVSCLSGLMPSPRLRAI